MADIYVRSTDGDNGDDGSTWALAKETLTGAAAIDVAGDTIWVSQDHAESTAAAITLNIAGSNASPVRIICGSDAAEPPTAVSQAATVTTTGANSINLIANACFMHGVNFEVGTGASTANMVIGVSNNNQDWKFNQCNFRLNTTAAGARINVWAANGDATIWQDCGVKFGNASQTISHIGAGSFTWIGGSIESGGTAPTALLKPTANTFGVVVISGVDLSNGATGMNLVDAGNAAVQDIIIFRDCKLPSSWSGSLLTNRMTAYAGRAEMWNCDSGDTNYQVRVSDYAGDLTEETTLIKTGGASDGTTPLSFKVVTTANAEETFPFVTPEIVKKNTTVGSAITVTVDVLHDSLTNMQNDEIWLEVMYLGTSGFPLGTWVRDDVAGDNSGNFLATAADQAASGATWTTTGMTNPNEQKLSVTFTPQEVGYVHARVYVAMPSKTLYVDPALQIS